MGISHQVAERRKKVRDRVRETLKRRRRRMRKRRRKGRQGRRGRGSREGGGRAGSQSGV